MGGKFVLEKERLWKLRFFYNKEKTKSTNTYGVKGRKDWPTWLQPNLFSPHPLIWGQYHLLGWFAGKKAAPCIQQSSERSQSTPPESWWPINRFQSFYFSVHLTYSYHPHKAISVDIFCIWGYEETRIWSIKPCGAHLAITSTNTPPHHKSIASPYFASVSQCNGRSQNIMCTQMAPAVQSMVFCSVLRWRRTMYNVWRLCVYVFV